MTEAWGRPPWHVDVDVPDAPPPSHAHVAVVGAGFAGLATAWELVRRGVDVTVLEAGRIGAGASGHTGALALEGTAIGPLADADRVLESVARVTREAGADCDLRLDGCWELTHEPDPSAAGPRWRDGAGELRIDDTVPGGTLDAGAVLSGMARAVLRRGGTIHEGARVASLDVGAVRRLRTTRGDVVAERVVVATNAYLPTLLALPVDLRPALTLAVATAPLSQAHRDAIGFRLPFYTVDLPYLWGRELADGSLVFGSGLVFPAGPDVRDTTTTSDEAIAIFDRLDTRIRGLHRLLTTIEIPLRWGGPISFIPSRAPIISPLPADPNVIVTGGCAGHAVALSFRLGELIADHLTINRALPPWGAL